MSFLTTLKKLDLQQNPTAELSLDSKQIAALQSLLFKLGYAPMIPKSERGKYRTGTTSAIANFLKQKNLPGDGSFVTPVIIHSLLSAEKQVNHLKVLKELVNGGQIGNELFRGSSNKNAVIALQNCLNELGFGKELNWAKFGADGSYGGGTTKALAAFGNKEGIPVTGDKMNDELANRMIAELGTGLGSDWFNFDPIEINFDIHELLIDQKKIGSRTFHEVSDGFFTLLLRPFRKGFFTTGGEQVAQFLNKEKNASSLTSSSINMILAVSENEGKFDAINTWDNSFLSLGMYQWTLGASDNKGELPALLKKLKEADASTFNTLFGQYGIDISDDTGTTFGYLTKDGVKLNNANAKTPFRNEQWAYTFWRAAHHPMLKHIQIEHAIDRLKNFYWRDTAHGFTLSKIITSEYGVALILDNHVNRPAFVKKCIAKAMETTGLMNPQTWSTTEENKVIDAYLTIRRFFPFAVNHPMSDSEKNRPMTDAAIREKRTKKRLNNGLLSNQRGSFEFETSLLARDVSRGLGNSSEGIDMSINVPKPSSFKQEHYPEIEHILEFEE